VLACDGYAAGEGESAAGGERSSLPGQERGG
jgi:hypothetical protein